MPFPPLRWLCEALESKLSVSPQKHRQAVPDYYGRKNSKVEGKTPLEGFLVVSALCWNCPLPVNRWQEAFANLCQTRRKQLLAPA